MPKICLLVLALFSTQLFAQKAPKESLSLEKPPVIDGDITDWPGEWWVDPDGKFFCNVANDADNLYVRLKVADDLTQQKLGLFGLSLKLNPAGKRKGKIAMSLATIAPGDIKPLGPWETYAHALLQGNEALFVN